MSHLQRVAAAINTLLVTRLKTLRMTDLSVSAVRVSQRTWKAYNEYEKARAELRASIVADYNLYETRYRERHKLVKDESLANSEK